MDFSRASTASTSFPSRASTKEPRSAQKPPIFVPFGGSSEQIDSFLLPVRIAQQFDKRPAALDLLFFIDTVAQQILRVLGLVFSLQYSRISGAGTVGQAVEPKRSFIKLFRRLALSFCFLDRR